MKINNLKRFSPIITLKVIFTLLFVIIGCDHPNKKLIDQAPAISLSFKDDLQRKIELPRAPLKIISLSPSINDILIEIKAQPRLIAAIAVDEKMPEGIQPLPVHEDLNQTLNEALTLEPDIILFSDDLFNEPKSLAQTLDSLKIPNAFFTIQNLEDLFQDLQTIGQIAEQPQETEAYIQKMKKFIQIIHDRADNHRPKTATMIYNLEPLTVVGKNHIWNELLELAGGKNSFKHINAPIYAATMNEIASQNPEVLMVAILEDEKQLSYLVDDYPTLSKTKAIQNQQLYPLYNYTFKRPGPKTIDALGILANILHPKTNPEEAYQKAFQNP